MKHPMFCFIHKLNRSVFSIKDFNPDKKNFTLPQELKVKRAQGGLTISSLIFGCDDPTYNPSPVGKSSLLTGIFSLNLPAVPSFS